MIKSKASIKIPIYEALQKYVADDIYPFHMPGHKQGRGLNIADAMQIDITEVEGVDNLHHADSVILESQKLAADLFGADETFFLINGSSSGIIATILTVFRPNRKILISRNCHKSVYSGLMLSGAEPIYIEPEIIADYGLAGGINPSEICQALSDNNINAVIITSPTYEGFSSNIKSIADIAHNHDAVLIVDEAHGAHFKFHNSFPKTALEQGADIVVQSLHKTLPSLTQTALIHVQGNRVDRQRLKQMLSVMQSSSPSYILMSSIDLCIAQLSQNNFDTFLDRLNDFRYQLRNTNVLQLLGEELNNTDGISEIDISKLVIYCCTESISGSDLDSLLRKKYRLQMEMSGLKHIVGIATVADTDEGFKRLLTAIYDIDKDLKYAQPEINYRTYVNPNIAMTPREAMFKSKISVPIENSLNKISAEMVIPYPPGIPILVAGEVITQEIIDIIYIYKKNCIPILATKDYTQDTLQIIE